MGSGILSKRGTFVARYKRSITNHLTTIKILQTYFLSFRASCRHKFFSQPGLNQFKKKKKDNSQTWTNINLWSNVMSLTTSPEAWIPRQGKYNELAILQRWIPHLSVGICPTAAHQFCRGKKKIFLSREICFSLSCTGKDYCWFYMFFLIAPFPFFQKDTMYFWWEKSWWWKLYLGIFY